MGKGLPSSYSTIIVGFALKFTSSTSTSLFDITRLLEGATQHLTLSFQPSSGKLTLRRGLNTGTLLATSTTTFNASTWYYLELRATINDSTGAYELRVNGVSDFSASNVDTRNGGTSGVIDTWSCAPGSTGGIQFTYDDFYICDTSGSSNNDFLGDCRIDTLLPNGDGNYTQFSPSTGTAHYALVDETTPNTTDYNYSSTAGDRDSYTFPDLAGLVSPTVYGVQIDAYMTKADAGTRTVSTMSRLSGTNKDGATVVLSAGSYAYVSQIQETDPASAAWTESNVNAAEFGVRVVA